MNDFFKVPKIKQTIISPPNIWLKWILGTLVNSVIDTCLCYYVLIVLIQLNLCLHSLLHRSKYENDLQLGPKTRFLTTQISQIPRSSDPVILWSQARWTEFDFGLPKKFWRADGLGIGINLFHNIEFVIPYKVENFPFWIFTNVFYFFQEFKKFTIWPHLGTK